MSYLSPPRLSFLGGCYANAATATNNDIASVFDVDLLKLNNQMDLLSGGKAIPPLPDIFNWQNATSSNPALRTWLMGLMQGPTDEFNEDGFKDKDGNVVSHAQMAHWNYYGDHNTEFQQAKINGATLASGLPAPATDAVFQLEAELLGDIFYGRRRGAVLVDVDPYALVTSQIFAGQFRLSYKQTPILQADHPTPAYAYFINPYKNLNPGCEGFERVSAVFQFGLDRDNIAFVDDPAFNSPALNDLKAKAMAGRGLMVRYCFYDALFKIQAKELSESFAAGKYIFNPYLGTVLGTVGVWNEGELASAPVGRKLRVQSQYTCVAPPNPLTPEQHVAKRAAMTSIARYRPRPLPAVTDPKQPPMVKGYLGATLAQVDTVNSVVSLDCINTFPEATIGTRDKYNFGPISLVLLYGDNMAQSVTVGSVPNDKATYESGGGVVDISYAASADKATIDANIGAGQLALYGPDFQLVSPMAKYPLVEPTNFDTQTDDRAVYFDAKVLAAGNAPVAGTSTITIQIMNKGVAPTTPTKLNLEYWMCQKDYVNPDKPQVPVPADNPYFSVTCDGGVTPLSTTQYTLGYLILGPGYPCNDYPGGIVNVKTDQVIVPVGGKLTLTLTAQRPGVSIVRFVESFTDPASNVAPNFGWDNVDYSTVRILPFDDYSQFSDEQINNWEFMYNEVFGMYSVMYPIMSKIIPWGPSGAPNNPTVVKQFASQLLAFTDISMWQSTIYMPISRDMSGGKRELLRRWCNLQQ